MCIRFVTLECISLFCNGKLYISRLGVKLCDFSMRFWRWTVTTILISIQMLQKSMCIRFVIIQAMNVWQNMNVKNVQIVSLLQSGANERNPSDVEVEQVPIIFNGNASLCLNYTNYERMPIIVTSVTDINVFEVIASCISSTFQKMWYRIIRSCLMILESRQNR